ncbi:hypothetical protein JCM33374_g2374 [Metschnikowia sp. JCM 33374]|nr:hypothetical protein JCM33374_g2374 [Metschnikowia sp. JCM 33374]
MLFSLLTLVGLFSLVLARAAPRSRDSPPNTVYRASFNKHIRGSVSFSSFFGYVVVRVNLSGLPRTGAPFEYDIHEHKIPESGDCGEAGNYFNPYDGDEYATTDALKPVGDLSGKHGTIDGTSYRSTYIDPYLSTNTHNRAYVGGLGLVVHDTDFDDIDCANINYVGRNGAPAAIMAGNQTENGGAPQDAGPDTTEVIDGVTEIVGAYYAKETAKLEELKAELPKLDASDTGVTV